MKIGRCLVSRSAVSEVTDAFWEEYEAFTKRDLLRSSITENNEAGSQNEEKNDSAA